MDKGLQAWEQMIDMEFHPEWEIARLQSRLEINMETQCHRLQDRMAREAEIHQLTPH